MTTWVDPPMGWRYGFPKPFTFQPSHPNLPGEEYEQEYRQWFVDEGYPRELANARMLDHTRFWDEYEEN